MNERVVYTPARERAGSWAMGGLFERLVTAAESGGQLGISIVLQPPGIAPPLHVHTREAEAWFILEGTMTYVAGDLVVNMGPGDFIYLPRNLPHTFRTTGSTPVRYLGLTTPGRLLDIYDEVGVPATRPGLPDGGIPTGDVERWLELAPSYGLRVVGPPIPPKAA